MTLHMGHLLGLHLIKVALAGGLTEAEVAVASPISEGSDSGKRAVSEMFDSLPNRDTSMPLDSLKTSAEANFSGTPAFVERVNEAARLRHRDPDDVDGRRISVDRAWREHFGYRPQDGSSLPEIAAPGPAK